MAFQIHSFAEATAIKSLDSHTYVADFKDDWAIGTVPHGGYVTACFLAVTQLHFSTTLARQNQPHALSLHLEFLRRTSVGPATFRVADSKLGRATSVVHVMLVQDGDREEAAGYITHSNLESLTGVTGITLNTQWALDGPEVPPVDLARLGVDGEDVGWVRAPNFYPRFRKALERYDMFVPRAGRQLRSVVDEWLRLRSGERFTNVNLGSVADMFPLMLDGYMDVIKAERAVKNDADLPKFWYPTLSLNLEIKKKLPNEGVEWLFVRVRAKEIKNGRNDLDLVVLDEHGSLVAISHHTAMIVDASRNSAARKNKGNTGSNTSKI